MKQAMILMTDIPVPDKMRNRLMPYYSENQCVALHKCFIQDITAAMREADGDLFVCYTGKSKEQGAEVWLEHYLGQGINCFPQDGADLGEKMFQAISYVLGLGYDACLLVCSDIPELSTRDLKEAWEVLKRHDVVFGPTKDGGYYMVGMKQPWLQVFSGKTYHHDHVLQDAITSAKEAGLAFGMTRRLQNVNTLEDLSKLKLNRGLTRSNIRDNRKVSIIVPIYNEEKKIQALQSQLRLFKDDCEIILVDGGSKDRTLSMIQEDFQVLHSPKGKAKQMNYGAEHSHGEILFFMSSDCELPDRFMRELRLVMDQRQAGCFGIAFNSADPFLWLYKCMLNLRAKYGRIMSGNQCIFIERDLFFDLGGFLNLPIMEYYQLSLDLKRRGIVPGMTKSRIHISSRRLPKGGLSKMKYIWQMHVLRRWYRKDVPMKQILQAYKKIRKL